MATKHEKILNIINHQRNESENRTERLHMNYDFIIKKVNNNRHGLGHRQTETLVCYLWKCKMVQLLLENHLAVSQTVKYIVTM